MTANTTVSRAWDQAVMDMEALRLEDPTFERGVFIPAAGVPWFVTLFGRDSLIVSMQSIAGYPEFASGALRRLSKLQATEDDPERDMEPGKIPHEIRHGELAQLGILPFQPYYGTHDATSLFIIVLSYLYQWLGREDVLRRYLPNAEAALDWIDRFGDRDRDGLQEYRTRSRHGYYNQGWKDAGDAIRPCRWDARAAVDRDDRAPGLRVRRQDPDGGRVRHPRPAGRCRPPAARGRPPVRAGQRALLVGGGGDVLPRPRRSQAADRERRLQSGPSPDVGDRARSTGRSGSSSA